MTLPVSQDGSLDGAALRTIFAAAAEHLRAQAKAIDAINVYPVPDGDTGSNMAATLREAVERVQAIDGLPSVPDVLATLARGALYGARGNSGVILSQALRGFAAGVGAAEAIDGPTLATGLESAAAHAYRAVSQPQEGTMLTVMREAGGSARAFVEASGSRDCREVLRAAVRSAEVAEAATMEQLPALQEAGVPDAGGEGVCTILRGLLGALTGAVPAGTPARLPVLAVGIHGGDHEPYGSCTEFLLERNGHLLDIDGVRAFVESSGNRSVVVVGDSEVVRVHVHTLDPEAVLAGARELGRVSRVKVEDMSAQNVRFVEGGSGAGVKVGLLAMSRGAGFDDIFESLGAAVSDLGVVEKPPAGQIAEAADRLRIADVIVLANHRNVVLAAEQARELAECTLHVVGTTSLPQGIAAAMAFDRDETATANVAALQAAANQVRTVEVTFAGADRTSDGIAVKAGQAIALVDGRLAAAGETTEAVLADALSGLEVARGSLITLYAGEGVSTERANQLAETLRERHNGAEVEVVRGGQPLYAYIASVE